MLDRDAVFQKLDRAEAVDRYATSADVARRFAARRLNPEAGHGFQRFSNAGRGLEAQIFLVDVGDRIAGFRLGPHIGARAAGNDDVVDIAALRIDGIVGGGRLLRQCGRRASAQ